MPNIYDGYCYSTIAEAATAEISRPIFGVSSGLVDLTSFSASTATVGTMTFLYKPMSTSPGTTYTMSRTYPACVEVGYQHNLTGIDLVDAITVSWLVVLVWVIAYGFKILRRTL